MQRPEKKRRVTRSQNKTEFLLLSLLESLWIFPTVINILINDYAHLADFGLRHFLENPLRPIPKLPSNEWDRTDFHADLIHEMEWHYADALTKNFSLWSKFILLAQRMFSDVPIFKVPFHPISGTLSFFLPLRQQLINKLDERLEINHPWCIHFVECICTIQFLESCNIHLCLYLSSLFERRYFHRIQSDMLLTPQRNYFPHYDYFTYYFSFPISLRVCKLQKKFQKIVKMRSIQ